MKEGVPDSVENKGPNRKRWVSVEASLDTNPKREAYIGINIKGAILAAVAIDSALALGGGIKQEAEDF